MPMASWSRPKAGRAWRPSCANACGCSAPKSTTARSQVRPARRQSAPPGRATENGRRYGEAKTTREVALRYACVGWLLAVVRVVMHEDVAAIPATAKLGIE